MKIQGMGTVSVNPVKLQENKEISRRETRESGKASIDTRDVFVPATASKTAVYSRPVEARSETALVDGKTVNEDVDGLLQESERAYSQLREIVRQMLERQGLTFNDLTDPSAMVEVDEETRLEAARMIGEGGEYSVETVSDRIVDFAKALSGGDKSKLDTLREAIDKGFSEAAKAWGGELPGISKETYKAVQEKLDDWMNEE